MLAGNDRAVGLIDLGGRLAFDVLQPEADAMDVREANNGLNTSRCVRRSSKEQQGHLEQKQVGRQRDHGIASGALDEEYEQHSAEEGNQAAGKVAPQEKVADCKAHSHVSRSPSGSRWSQTDPDRCHNSRARDSRGTGNAEPQIR